MSEKALAIATYARLPAATSSWAAPKPGRGSENVQRLMNETWEKKVGGRLEFVPEGEEIVRRALAAHRPASAPP